MIFPLRYKLALLISALLVSGIGLVSYLLFDQSVRALETQVAERGKVMAEALATSARNPLLEQDDVVLTRLVQSTSAKPEIRAARLLDHTGRIVASSVAFERETRERIARGSGVSVRSREGTLLIGAPMRFGAEAVGEAQIVMELAAITQPMIAEARRNVLLASGALLIVALGIAIALSQRITRPLQRLQVAAKALAAGEAGAQVASTTRDEIGELTHAFNEMSESIGQKDRIERAFRRYVSDHVLREVVNDPSSVELRGERREVTVMFVDIRQFTRLTSWLGPERLVAFLNETFELITGRLLEHGATVDKYVGDAILAYTGAPIPTIDHAQRAVAAAIAIQRSVEERNSKAESEGRPFVRLEVGIGIHTGQVVVGNIGSELKMDFTAIGEPVNLASRLQEIAGPGQILITGQVEERLGGALETEHLGPTQLEGIDRDVDVHQIRY